MTSPTIPRLVSIDFNASFDNDSAVSRPKDLEFLPHNPSGHLIVGSCRGFILFNYECRKLCLWNPFSQNCGFSVYVLDPIFSSTDDYLVFQLPLTPLGELSLTLGHLFSFRTNERGKIETCHLTYRETFASLNDRTGLFLNGAIHLVAFNSHVSRNVIVVFDLTQRSFSEIPLPPVVLLYIEAYCYLLGVLGGLLSLSYQGLNRAVEIWVMKEYKVQSSWTKTIVVSAGPTPRRDLSQICYTKSGDLVGIQDYTKLVKYNSKGHLIEALFFSDTPHHCDLFLSYVVYT